jgi:hypothetical protein
VLAAAFVGPGVCTLQTLIFLIANGGIHIGINYSVLNETKWYK